MAPRHTLTLTDTGCALLGLVPHGPVEPGVYGLVPLQRRQYGWLFVVVEPWRIDMVRRILRCTRVRPGAAQTRRTVLSRLGA